MAAGSYGPRGVAESMTAPLGSPGLSVFGPSDGNVTSYGKADLGIGSTEYFSKPSQPTELEGKIAAITHGIHYPGESYERVQIDTGVGQVIFCMDTPMLEEGRNPKATRRYELPTDYNVDTSVEFKGVSAVNRWLSTIPMRALYGGDKDGSKLAQRLRLVGGQTTKHVQDQIDAGELWTTVVVGRRGIVFNVWAAQGIVIQKGDDLYFLLRRHEFKPVSITGGAAAPGYAPPYTVPLVPKGGAFSLTSRVYPLPPPIDNDDDLLTEHKKADTAPGDKVARALARRMLKQTKKAKKAATAAAQAAWLKAKAAAKTSVADDIRVIATGGVVSHYWSLDPYVRRGDANINSTLYCPTDYSYYGCAIPVGKVTDVIGTETEGSLGALQRNALAALYPTDMTDRYKASLMKLQQLEVQFGH